MTLKYFLTMDTKQKNDTKDGNNYSQNNGYNMLSGGSSESRLDERFKNESKPGQQSNRDTKIENSENMGRP